jgi:hypothetical protein
MLPALAMVVATALATNERVPDDRLEDAIGVYAGAALDLARALDFRPGPVGFMSAWA